MTNNFYDTYNFELRLATREEIDGIAEFLAQKNWKDNEKHLKPIAKDVKEAMVTNFISQNKKNILELIGSKVLAQDYKKHGVSLFIYSYNQEFENNVITSLTFRVLQNKNGMELLQDEDVVFNLEDLQNNHYHKNKEKQGRPNKPKSESIQKTIEIKKYLESNPISNMDAICQEFGIGKTTYYRVIKWLSVRNR